MEAQYASRGVANTGLGLGIAGTALGLLGNGLASSVLGGVANNNSATQCDDKDRFITQEVFELQQKLATSETANALLSADLNSEKKMVEVFNAANDKIMSVRDELQTYIRTVDQKVDSNAAAQAVINCGFTSADAVLQTQVAQIMGLTKLGIPNSSLCPGYGNVTITPTTSATTT